MYIKEVTASLYPWDLADEGVETCLEHVTQMAGANSVYLIGLMHWEKRPLTDRYYPHNPVRKYYIPENSRVYYHVPEQAFDGQLLRPRTTDRDFLKGTDWLDLLSAHARKRNLKVGVEISHTSLDSELLMAQFPQVLQKDIAGQPISGSYPCPNNPDYRQYLSTLFHETVKHHDIDFIQNCLFLFHSGNAASINSGFSSDLERTLNVVNGGCFCDACRDAAVQKGYDWDLICRDTERLHTLGNATASIGDMKIEKAQLLSSGISAGALLLEYPGVYEWMRFRMDSVAGLLEDLYEAVKSAKPEVEVRYNHCFEFQEFMGLRHRDLKGRVDSVRDSDYSEQTGSVDRLYVKNHQITRIRRGVGFDMPVLAAIGIRPSATPEIIRESIRRIAQAGIDGLSLGHYDGASYAALRAVREGMADAELEILP